MTTTGKRVEVGILPVFPTTYAHIVVDHAAHKQTRGSGRNASMPFLDEKNPRRALDLAKATIENPDGVIRDRLRNLATYLPGQQKIVYDFAAHIANYVNAELVPQGFVMAAVLALYDLQVGVNGYTNEPIRSNLVGQPPMIYKIIEMMIPKIAEAAFPPDFADVVQETMDNVHQIQKDEWEKAKAVAPKATIIGDPLTIYTAARKVADLAYQFYSSDPGAKGKYWLGDQRTQDVNAFYNQTTGGLFLEQYYGIPGSIWTPWGKWSCWGGGGGLGKDGNDALKAFLAAIGEVELFAAANNTAQGTIGPIYAIKKVGDIELPKPELRQRVSYFEYEDANRLWAEVKAQFDSQ